MGGRSMSYGHKERILETADNIYRCLQIAGIEPVIKDGLSLYSYSECKIKTYTRPKYEYFIFYISGYGLDGAPRTAYVQLTLDSPAPAEAIKSFQIAWPASKVIGAVLKEPAWPEKTAK